MLTSRPSVTLSTLSIASLLLFAAACGEDGHDHQHSHDTPVDGGVAGDAGTADAQVVAHALFATEGETLIAFDVATGAARPATLANVKGPTDLQATDTGHLLVNLTATNEILVVDARTFREVARIKASDTGATRPVHAYVTPEVGGKRYWVANNDGEPGMAATNSLRFVDLTPGSATFLQAVGEIPLGLGHHKDAWSGKKARVSVSNIADCANVAQVIDYSDASKPRLVKKWSAADLDPTRDCMKTGAGPHGGAGAENGHAYHNLTGWGAILAIDQDKDDPTFKLLPTKGVGGGYTKAGKDGRWVYSLQRSPREGDATRPGVDCQIGNLVVIDSQSDSVATEVPILLEGTDCKDKLPAWATLVGPDNLVLAKDGKRLFVATQAEAPMGSTNPAYSDREVVFDLTDPAKPAQLASIKVGKHAGHRAHRVSGDGQWLFVVNGEDNTISQVKIADLTVTRTIPLKGKPAQLATWGSAEGPSAQVGPH